MLLGGVKVNSLQQYGRMASLNCDGLQYFCDRILAM